MLESMIKLTTMSARPSEAPRLSRRASAPFARVRCIGPSILWRKLKEEPA